MSYKNSVTKLFCEISSLFIVVQYIQLFQKRLSDRMANGECRKEVARPKGTVFTLFNMQNFISCVHLTWKWIHQLWTFVLGFLAPKTVEAHAFLNWKTFLVSSYERPIRDLIRSDDGDGNGNATKAIGLISKTTILHVHHAFLYVSLPLRLRRENAKFHDVQGKYTSDDEISSFFLNLGSPTFDKVSDLE